MRYLEPLVLTGSRYVRMEGVARERVDGWLSKHGLLERYRDINSIEIVGSHVIRLILFGGDPVRLLMKSPLSLAEWIEAIDQADADLNEVR